MLINWKCARRLGSVVFLGIALASATMAVRADDVKDASGRAVVAGNIGRIVSIGGDVTEILYALGMDKRIVGIDTTSTYPLRAAAEKASVGYMRQLSAEGVLGLNPTLILTVEGAGPKETIAVLEAAHVPLVVARDTFTGEGIIEKVSVIAQATGTAARGRCIIERVRADLGLSFVSGRAMVSGRNTAADGIINLAGAVNAVTDYEGYKAINDEAVIAAKPDVILVIERGGPATLTADMVFAHPSFAVTPAGFNRSFVSMDGLYLLGFGPRTARAARDLAGALYPHLKSETLKSDGNDGRTGACWSL
jgi:iron complex transport system substrate-binding protein